MREKTSTANENDDYYADGSRVVVCLDPIPRSQTINHLLGVIRCEIERLLLQMLEHYKMYTAMTRVVDSTVNYEVEIGDSYVDLECLDKDALLSDLLGLSDCVTVYPNTEDLNCILREVLNDPDEMNNYEEAVAATAGAAAITENTLCIRTSDCKGLIASPRPHTHAYKDGTILTVKMFDTCITECSVCTDEVPIGIDAQGNRYTMFCDRNRVLVNVKTKTNDERNVCAYQLRNDLVQAQQNVGVGSLR